MLLEDDVWTTARIDPTRLPTGSLSMLPSTTFLRLLHVPIEAQRAEASMEKRGDRWIYAVRYPDLGRTLTIELEKGFPYRIAKWSEAMARGVFGRSPSRPLQKRKRPL